MSDTPPVGTKRKRNSETNNLKQPPRRQPQQQPQQYPNEKLQDFWKTLWHVDVQKDHGNDYDTEIVNNFLFNNTYATTQTTLNGKFISKLGQRANRTIQGSTLTFADLFNYLTSGVDYADITSYPIGTQNTIQLNPELMGPDINYSIRVYDDKGDGLHNSITTDSCLYVDTTSHLPELMDKYRLQSGSKPLYYAYTREIQSDPADKITYKTIGESNKTSFYYELQAPENPSVVPFPPYSKTDGMSYFYCKYPLFLKYNGIKDPKKYNLSVELSYMKDGKSIAVVEDAKIAGAIKKFTNGIKKLAGIKTDDISKEIVFISKHHGDVAQSLVQFRDVRMTCPANGSIINTSSYKGIFVSIDVNAIIKALTVGMPYIIMYPPDKEKIIVWKNQKLDNIEDLYASENNLTMNKYNKLKNSIEIYNTELNNINRQKQVFDQIVQERFQADQTYNPNNDTLENIKNRYVEIIKFGIRVAILSKYLPKTDLVKIEIPNFETQINEIAASDEEYLPKIYKLKEIQKELSQFESSLKVPEQYTTLKVVTYTAEIPQLAETSLEKDLFLEFIESRVIISARGGKLKDLWESIDLSYNMGDLSISSRVSRLTTKLNTSWGIDIVKYIFTNLNNYDNTLSIQLIQKLLECLPTTAPATTQANDVPSKKTTFEFGLGLVDIQIPVATVPAAPQLPLEEQLTQPVEYDAEFLGGRIKTSPREMSRQSVHLTRKSLRTGTKKSMRKKTIKKSIKNALGSTINTINTIKTVKAVAKKKALKNLDLQLKALDSEFNDMIAHAKLMIDILYISNDKLKLPTNEFKEFGKKAVKRFIKSVFKHNFLKQQLKKTQKAKKASSLKKQKEKQGGASYEPFNLQAVSRTLHDLAAPSTNEKVNAYNTASTFLSTYNVFPLYEDIITSMTAEKNMLDQIAQRLKEMRELSSREERIKQIHQKIKQLSELIIQIKRINDAP